MRADMASESDRVGSRTHSAREDEIAVLLRKAEQERGVCRVMRHADEIWLCQIIYSGGLEQVDEGVHVFGHTLSLLRNRTISAVNQTVTRCAADA